MDDLKNIAFGGLGGVVGMVILLWVSNKIDEWRLKLTARRLRSDRSL